jgi:hypothetical protein
VNDRPTAAELIDAVRLYLEKELLPALADQRQRFQTLVAANVLAIAGRELAGEEEMLRQEWHALGGEGAPPARLAELRQAVRGLNGQLCQRVKNGNYDDPERRRELLALLRRQVTAKLAVANPRSLEAPGRR